MRNSWSFLSAPFCSLWARSPRGGHSTHSDVLLAAGTAFDIALIALLTPLLCVCGGGGGGVRGGGKLSSRLACVLYTSLYPPSTILPPPPTSPLPPSLPAHHSLIQRPSIFDGEQVRRANEHYLAVQWKKATTKTEAGSGGGLGGEEDEEEEDEEEDEEEEEIV